MSISHNTIHSNLEELEQGVNVSVAQDDGSLSSMVLRNTVLSLQPPNSSIRPVVSVALDQYHQHHASERHQAQLHQTSNTLDVHTNGASLHPQMAVSHSGVLHMHSSSLQSQADGFHHTHEHNEALGAHSDSLQSTDELSSADAFHATEALVHFDEDTGSQSDNLVSYSGVMQDGSSDLVSYGQQSNSGAIHYTVSSQGNPSRLVTYSDATQTDQASLVQYSDQVQSGASPGLVQYTDGRDGLTITSLPLLAENSLVNLVGLGDGLGLESHNLEGNSVMLRSDFGTDASAISVMGGTDDGGGLSILDGRGRKTGGDNVTYLTHSAENTESNVGLDNGTGVAGGTQYHQLTAVGTGQTVHVPINFLNSTNLSLLSQTLSMFRVGADQQLILIPHQFAPDMVASPSVINNSNAMNSTLPDMIPHHHQQQQQSHHEQQQATTIYTLDNNEFTILNNQANASSSSAPLSLNNTVSVGDIHNRMGRPSGSVSTGLKGVRSRVLGSGPLAISAQGIVQQVGGRRVTVLPRPEDLQRLKEQKALVVDLPDKKALSLQRRRGPVPVRPHQRYGRGVRGGRRGRPPLHGGVVEAGFEGGVGSLEEADRDPALAGVVRGGVTKRGRRGRRGRGRRGGGTGRGRGVMVVNSTGKRPGRPKKAITLLEGPQGARMIHTGPSTTSAAGDAAHHFGLMQDGAEDGTSEMSGPTTSQHEQVPKHVLQQDLPRSLADSRRKLPPRNRGNKYSKMIEALIRPDDEIPSESSDDDPDFLGRQGGKAAPRAPPPQRTGKRGRPRKHPLPVPVPFIKFTVTSRPPFTVPRPSLPIGPHHAIIVSTGVPGKSKPSISYQNFTNQPNPFVPNSYSRPFPSTPFPSASLPSAHQLNGSNQFFGVRSRHSNVMVTTRYGGGQPPPDPHDERLQRALGEFVGEEGGQYDEDELHWRQLVLSANSSGGFTVSDGPSQHSSSIFIENSYGNGEQQPSITIAQEGESCLDLPEVTESQQITINNIDDRQLVSHVGHAPNGSYAFSQQHSDINSTDTQTYGHHEENGSHQGIPLTYAISQQDNINYSMEYQPFGNNENINDNNNIINTNKKQEMYLPKDDVRVIVNSCSVHIDSKKILLAPKRQDELSIQLPATDTTSMDTLSSYQQVTNSSEETFTRTLSNGVTFQSSGTGPHDSLSWRSNSPYGEPSNSEPLEAEQDKKTEFTIKCEPVPKQFTLTADPDEEEEDNFMNLTPTEDSVLGLAHSPSERDFIKREEDGGPSIFLDSCPSPEESLVDEASVIVIKEEQTDAEGHKCDECGELIPFKRDFIRHLRLKHNLRPFECGVCGKTFTSVLSLQDHELVHSLEKPFRCSVCGDTFEKQATLKLHQMEHMDESDFTCDKCGRRLDNASQLKKHMLQHQEGAAYSCDVCGKMFGTKESHMAHMKGHKKERTHVCDICNIGFFSSGGLNRHRKVHKRNEETDGRDLWCTKCYANFSYEDSLKKHMSLVHGIGVRDIKDENTTLPMSEDRVVEELQEQLNEGYAPKNSELYDVPVVSETLESKFPTDPFRCGICEESFTDVDMLCDHFTNCHTGEQKLYCDTCCVGCSHEDQLERHKVVHVTEEQHTLIRKWSEDLPHVCQLCGKSYKSIQELSKHNRVHTVDKPYKCIICTASFPIKSALDKHLLVHTGERPFKCDVCLKSFRQSAALVRHKLWTHRLKNQNKCEFCGKTFFTAALLIYHLDVHGEVGRQLQIKLKETEDLDGENEVAGRDEDFREETRNADDPTVDREKNIHNKCEYCSKSFPSYVALLTHKLTHKLSASYKCDQCHRTFREKRYLQKHKMTHRGVRSWKCDICKKGFAAKLTLIRHSQVHIREALRPALESRGSEDSQDGVPSAVCTLPAILRCNECNVNFSHKSHYVRHKLLHSGTPLLKCGLCDKMFVHKSDIIRHKVMHSFMFTCDICNRNFHKRSLYMMHKRKHMDDKPFKCGECLKSFSSSSNYNAHKRIHSGDKPFKCDQCPYRCSQSGRLMKHKRMHSGVKPFLCSTCGRFFANAESIKVHQRLHTGDRPFKCGQCPKSFINSGSLAQHMRDHAKEDMFHCARCDLKFRRQTHLDKHLLYHQQEAELGGNPPTNSYMCNICGRVFDKKKYLYTHGNVHNRNKNYKCTVCQKHLASRLALKNHELIHSGLMPYKCDLCPKTFRSSSNLKRHVRVHEGHESLRCLECGETFISKEDLDRHSHVHLMMVNAATVTEQDGPASNSSAQLYVFESMPDGMDSQPILVNDSQQQLFVDGSQPLLVFPESSDSQFSELHSVDHESLDSQQLTEAQLASSQLGGHVLNGEVSHQLGSPSNSSHALESEEMEIVGHDHHHQPLVASMSDSQEEEDTKVISIMPTQVQGMDGVAEDMDSDQNILPELEFSTPTTQTYATVAAPSTSNTNVVKSHQCNVCFRTYAKKQYLTKHMYRHRDVKPHECDVCGKRFAQKFEVVVHKIKHTGEKPYTCDICNKQFRSKVNLNNHKMRHNGEFSYLCSVCRKGFSTQLQLERHVTLHTGMLPFNCHECGKGYSIKLNLIKHLAKAHNLTEAGVDHSEVQEEDQVSEDAMQSAEEHRQAVEDLQNSNLTVTVHSDDRAYKSEVGQISIKSEQDLMENFNGAPTITFFPKVSEQEITLSNDVSLTIGSGHPESETATITHMYHHDQDLEGHQQSQEDEEDHHHHHHHQSQRMAEQSSIDQQLQYEPQQRLYQIKASDSSTTINIGNQAQVYTSYVPASQHRALTSIASLQDSHSRSRGIQTQSIFRTKNSDSSDVSNQIPTSISFSVIDDKQSLHDHLMQQPPSHSEHLATDESHQHDETLKQLSRSSSTVTVLDGNNTFLKCFQVMQTDTGDIVSSSVDPKLLQAFLQSRGKVSGQGEMSSVRLEAIPAALDGDEMTHGYHHHHKEGGPHNMFVEHVVGVSSGRFVKDESTSEDEMRGTTHVLNLSSGGAGVVVQRGRNTGPQEKINVENISVAGSDNEEDEEEEVDGHSINVVGDEEHISVEGLTYRTDH